MLYKTCNMILGYAKDSPAVLSRLSEYLNSRAVTKGGRLA